MRRVTYRAGPIFDVSHSESAVVSASMMVEDLIISSRTPSHEKFYHTIKESISDELHVMDIGKMMRKDTEAEIEHEKRCSS